MGFVNWANRVEKHRSADLDGESVCAAALFYPRGSMLFSSYAGAPRVSGSIGDAISSKLDGAESEGDAGRIPASWGILALTDRRVLWFGARNYVLAAMPTKLLGAWPREEVAIEPVSGKGGYPHLLVRLPDGSAFDIVSDKRSAVQDLTEVWGAVPA